MQNGRVSKLSEQPLSPLDGRYRPQVRELGEHFSEAGLNRARIHVEIEWLIWLVQHNLVTTKLSLSAKEIQQLRALITNFSDDSVARLAKIEATTRHDVKAVEYFIREELEKLSQSLQAQVQAQTPAPTPAPQPTPAPPPNWPSPARNDDRIRLR